MDESNQGYTNPEMYDSDYSLEKPHFEDIQKWLLQTVNETLDEIKAEMQGKSWTQTATTAGYTRDTEKEPWANNEGVSNIIRVMKIHVNPTNLLANITEEQLEKIMLEFGFDLIDMVGDFQERWNIDDTMKDIIVDSISNAIWMILTRPTGGQDRTWFKNITYAIQKYSKVDDKEKGRFLGTPFGGGND